MRRVLIVLLVVSSAVSSAQTTRIEGISLRTHIFPRALEVQLAVSAGPEHLRNAAAVYVYESKGYVLARPGAKTGLAGVTCLVNRDAFLDGYEALKPTCFDPEGTARIVPMILREGEMLAKGVDAATIRKTIETAFQKKELEPPRRAGIAYMLQGDISAIDGKTGQVLARSHPPHLMFYAAGLSDADFAFGTSPIDGLAMRPFVYRRNQWHGYAIFTLSK